MVVISVELFNHSIVKQHIYSAENQNARVIPPHLWLTLSSNIIVNPPSEGPKEGPKSRLLSSVAVADLKTAYPQHLSH